jgi:hypothetical protein
MGSDVRVATESVSEGVALIIDAALSSFRPEDGPELAGVETALAALLSSDGPTARDVLRRARGCWRRSTTG